MAERCTNDRITRTDEKEVNRKVEGICVGAIAGAIIGFTTVGTLGYLGIAWGAGIGMVIGYFIGLNIKR